MSNHPATENGHETRDVRFAPVLFGSALIIGMVLIGAFAMVGLYDALAERESRWSEPANPLSASVGKLPPEPRLQALPIVDLQTLRAAEDRLLRGYQWIDRDAGVARIPIERAIDLLAERGGKGLQP